MQNGYGNSIQCLDDVKTFIKDRDALQDRTHEKQVLTAVRLRNQFAADTWDLRLVLQLVLLLVAVAFFVVGTPHLVELLSNHIVGDAKTMVVAESGAMNNQMSKLRWFHQNYKQQNCTRCRESGLFTHLYWFHFQHL